MQHVIGCVTTNNNGDITMLTYAYYVCQKFEGPQISDEFSSKTGIQIDWAPQHQIPPVENQGLSENCATTSKFKAEIIRSMNALV